MSSIRKIKSKRDNKDGGRLMFYMTDLRLSYLESTGFAAARIAVRELSWQTIPALAIEIVCCSIAYNKTVLEFSSILSN